MAAVLSASSRQCLAAQERNGYLGSINACVDALSGGQTDVAVSHAKAAIKWDANNPLTHVTLGLALLMGNRYSEARTAFSEAASLDANCAEAAYGQGLALLAEKKTKLALDALRKAQSPAAPAGLAGVLRYAAEMSGTNQGSEPGASLDKAELAMDALTLMDKQRFDDAAAIWGELQSSSATPGFREPKGLVLTFLPTDPLAVLGQPLRGSLGLPSKSTPDDSSLSGTIALRADLSKTQSVSMVAFFVDNQLAGVTNQSPFQYMWDTTRVSNGKHTLRIVGTDSGGFSVTEKTMTVLVKNRLSNPSPFGGSEPRTQEAWRRVRGLLAPRPSSAAINYHLAKCLLKTGQPIEARAAFERVMALDPDYLDTRHSLAALLKGRASRGKLYRVQREDPAIALTFDDGPSRDTPAILDVLRSKEVKATFFVVGKQAEAHPDLLKKIVAEGHEVQVHTYNHLALDFLTVRQIEQELFGTIAILKSVAGVDASFLRPPGGRCGSRLDEVTKRYGLTTVFWTANCTSLEGGRLDKMVNYLVSSARPGGIVLMHYAEGVTRRALPQAIDALRSQGYRFTTISELVGESAQQG